MSVEMAIWRMTTDGPKPLAFSPLGLEERLEDMIFSDPNLIGLDLLVLGRQVATDWGGIVDVLGMDADGRVHILELKRDRTPRDVVAQALDYGSWARSLTLDRISEIFETGIQPADASFASAFSDHFAQPLPDVVNPDQQLTIVASELDPASDRIVQYLAEEFGVPINVVFFRHFVDGEAEYLARTWLMTAEDTALARARSAATKVRPWNGRDFYVILGNTQQGTGRWDLAREYGMLNAGGGSWYWKPLRNLTPGSRVFAYVGGAGYVGVGTVRGSMVPGRDATVPIAGDEQRLIDQPGVPEWFKERALSEDPEVTEFVVPVDWTDANGIADAVAEPGLFSSQVTVCKLRDEHTIHVLEDRFRLADVRSS